VGIDLILGADPEGRDDVALEINPRFTTSYLGLRAACLGNLAAVLLSVAEDRLDEVRFDDQSIRFAADGEIHTGS
jgi:hypothetical protein